MTIRRALLSVSDKTGLIEFAKTIEQARIEIFQPVAAPRPYVKPT